MLQKGPTKSRNIPSCWSNDIFCDGNRCTGFLPTAFPGACFFTWAFNVSWHHRILYRNYLSHLNPRGGKVAMTVALSKDLPEGLLSHLIVADIAPSRGTLSPEFQGYVEAMKKIENSNVTTRRRAQEILEPYERVKPLFQISVFFTQLYLFVGLHRIPWREHFCWRICPQPKGLMNRTASGSPSI